jgi:hypothetical protein
VNATIDEPISNFGCGKSSDSLTDDCIAGLPCCRTCCALSQTNRTVASATKTSHPSNPQPNPFFFAGCAFFFTGATVSVDPSRRSRAVQS